MPEEKKSGISQEKARRIAVGATVAGVLLVIFFVVVLSVQFWQIGVKNKRNAEYDAQIEKLEEMLDKEQNDLDFYRTTEGLEYLASQQHWK